MKQFWSNSKEKIVAAEEGKACLEPVPKNVCKKFTQIVQFILVIEIALFLGWACFALYQRKYVSPVDVREDHLRISALKNNFKLNPESPNDSDVVTWQEKSSQNKAFNPPSSSEPWLEKTQNVMIPESSTESDLDLNNKDSVYHPQSPSPDVNTTPEKETSTEYVKETTENFEDRTKSLEADEIEKLDANPNRILLNQLQVQAEIEKLTNLENLTKESETRIPIVTETPGKMVEDETGSDIPQIPILISETDDTSSGIEDFKKELKQEIQTVLDNSQENEALSLPSFIKILHDLDKAEAENISTTEIVPSYVKKYHFQFSMGPETGIQESNDNLYSQEVSKQIPFFIHVFFNVSDSDVSSAENADSVLESEEGVLNPASPFTDPGFSGQPRIEDSPINEKTLKWWVNIPQFQETKVGGLSDEESQTESIILTSASENEESAEKSLFDLFFNQPGSQSLIPESDENEHKSNEVFEVHPENSDNILQSTEVLEAQPENLESLLPALVPQTLPDEDLIDQLMNDVEELSSKDSNDETVEKVTLEEALENDEALKKQIEDFIKALANVKISDENRAIIGSQTENHLHQEESMKMEEETDSGEDPEIPEANVAWNTEENWFHSQPTWKEESDGYLNDFIKNSEPEIYDQYDEASNFYSQEFMYDD